MHPPADPAKQPEPPDPGASGGPPRPQPSAGAPEAPAALPASPPTTRLRGEAERIGVALRGALPCAVCKYDLQGLSVRGVCPECGTAVRATILMMVDPRAEAFAPVTAPRATAVGLAVWSAAGFLATMLCWWPRLMELGVRAGVSVPRDIAHPDWMAIALVGLVCLSAVGAMALVWPVRGAHGLAAAGALAGIAAHALVGWGLWRIHAVLDRGTTYAYLAGPPNVDRVETRFVIAAGVVIALAGLRPNARRLVHRSLALRTGRVDRQAILAMIGAVAIAAAGDGLRLASIAASPPRDEIIDDLGLILIGVGSLLFTLGAAGAVVDSLRIGRAIVAPGPTIRQVIEGPSKA